MALGADGRTIKVEDKTNGQAVAPLSSRRRAPPARSWSFWLFNNAARLTIWYALFTIVFRCPHTSTGLTESSPQVCKPYLTAWSHVQPYVQPYYDKYASAHVEAVKPYLEEVNRRAVQPASSIAARNYQKYAAPQINKARDYTYSQWEKALLPQVLLVQERASNIYDVNVAPHVEKASSVAEPYYESAKDNAVNVHQKHILPALDYSRPRLQTAYAATQQFALKTGVPLIQHAWSNVIIFVDGTLWPFMKGVYSDNVRPQLVMISERIAKYQEGRKLQTLVDEAESSMEASSVSVTSTTADQTILATAAHTETPLTSTISLESASGSVGPSASNEPIVATDETISEDLVKWQKKFALAADKGADDLRDRVSHIIDSLVRSDVEGEGRGLATALEKTIKVEVDKVKSKITAVVASLPDDAAASEIAKAEEGVVRAVREAGTEIKGRAKKVRDFTSKFQADIKQRTSLAADSTLQVLDSIRDLGLQEIGMRWAWMEGVTYKHWAKYHDLKQRFEDWRNEVCDVAVKHPALEDAEEAAQRILEESMAITETAAKELIRLKQVGMWKIRARDVTDDFESRAMPAAAVSAASSLAAEIQDVTSGLAGSSQGTIQSLTSIASSSIVDAAGSASSLAKDVAGGGEGLLSEASSSAADVVSSASSAIVGTGAGLTESLSSSTSAFASSVSLAAADKVESGTVPPSDGIASSASSLGGTVSGSAKSAYSNVKDAASSVKLQSIVNGAGERVAELTSSLVSARL